MENSDTKGVGVSNSGFISTKTSSGGETSNTQPFSTNENDKYGIGQVPGLLKHLQGSFSFSAVLLSLVGYIVIAAFGQMNSIGKYIAYIGFILMLIIFYKSSETINAGKKNFGKYALIIGLIAAVLFILISNFSFFQKVYSTINTYFVVESKMKISPSLTQ